MQDVQSDDDNSADPTRPDSLAGIADRLRQLDATKMGATPRETAGKAYQVGALLQDAASLGKTDITGLRTFITEHLLPECLSAPEDEVRGRRHRAREILRDWLESLPEEVMWPVRNAVLQSLSEELYREPTVDVLYCLSVIGYRSDEIFKLLIELSERHNDLADLSLRVLTAMDPPPSELRNLFSHIESRWRNGASDELQFALSLVGTQEAANLLVGAVREADTTWPGLGRLARTCADRPGDTALQEYVWTHILDLAEQKTDGWQALMFTGGVVESCMVPSAIHRVIRRCQHCTVRASYTFGVGEVGC